MLSSGAVTRGPRASETPASRVLGEVKLQLYDRSLREVRLEVVVVVRAGTERRRPMCVCVKSAVVRSGVVGVLRAGRSFAGVSCVSRKRRRESESPPLVVSHEVSQRRVGKCDRRTRPSVPSRGTWECDPCDASE